MVETNQKEDKHYQVDLYGMFFLPIILLLGGVPLITRLKVVPTDQYTVKIFGQEQVFDFFSQYKAAAIIILSGLMLVTLMLIIGKEEIKKSKVLSICYLASFIYLAFSIASALQSEYSDLAMWGIADRAEGIVVLIGYIVMMLYTLYVYDKKSDYRYIIYPLCILIVITGVLGFFQYIGKDLLLKTELGRRLIVPEQYAQVREGLGSLYESGRIYGTMYHYNYIGSFGAMMVPLFLTLMVFMKGYKQKILFGLMTGISLFILFGSTSRAGLIGLIGSLGVFTIIYFRKIFKNYKWFLAVGALGIVMVVGLNFATKGAIFARIPAMVRDAKQMFSGEHTVQDYRDQLPIRGIQCIDNSILLEIQGDTLTVEATPYELLFRDQSGQVVDFTRGEMNYTTEDKRFKDLAFSNQRVGEGTTRDYVVISYQAKPFWVVEVNTGREAYLVDSKTLERIELEDPEVMLFQGKEKLGSARGYIWGRSLPMLKETLILGYGPDAYPLEFPQGDFFGKWYAYDTPHMIVDKPHNLYLQIAINQGVIALVAFLILVGTYSLQSLKLYALRKTYDVQEVIGSAFFIAIVGYLGAGIFNDSIVSVAPIFWILLGAGWAINYWTQQSRKQA